MKKILLIILLLPLFGNAQINIVKSNFTAINSFMSYNNLIFFYASDGTNEGTGLWKTDGTTGGTVFVKQLTNPIRFEQAEPMVSGGLLYFTTEGNNKLWRTDGTATGTFMLTNGLTTANFNKIDLNGILIFIGRDSSGDELWRTDGTIAGTYKIVDFNSGPNAGVYSNFNLVKDGNYIYFGGLSSSSQQLTLCKTDGTAAGTQIIPNAGVVQSLLVSVNDKFVFNSILEYLPTCVGIVGSPQNVSKIMKCENGIVSILQNPPQYNQGTFPTTYCTYFGNDFGNTQFLRKSGNKLFFSGYHYPIYGVNNTNDALWVTDGNSASKIKVFPQNTFTYNNNALEPFYFATNNSIDNTFFDGIFYFPAGDDNTGYEVWRSDGTTAGTFLLKDIKVGSASSTPLDFRTVNGITYFTADDGGLKRKLFKTDGTSNGTLQVPDPNNLLNSPSSNTGFNVAGNQKNLWSNAIGSKFLFAGTTTNGSGSALFSVCTAPLAPTLTSNAINNTICFGTQASLTASNCSGTVTWSTGATTSSITVSPTVNTTYTATCTDVCGVSPSGSITINVNPPPTVPTLSQTGTQVVCPNTTVNLSASNCNGSLTWSNGATTSTIIVNSAGTYNATCTNTCGTSIASSSFVLAHPNFTQNLSGVGLNGTTKAIQTISSSQNINNGINITYTAGKSIMLNPNFTANSGAVFKAEISTICPITNGLVASYNLDNNANDQSGNEHHTTFTNTTVTTGRKGDANGAYSFNGINQSIHLGTWFTLQEFTISMWLNAASTQNNPYAMIIDNNHGSNISFSTQQDFNTTNQYYFAVGGTPTYGYTGFSLTPNQWEHIVLVKGNGFMKVYKNGVLLGSTTHSGLIDYTSTIPALCLGAYVNNGNNIRYWAGKMDDIKIYNRAVSDVEVSYLFSE